MDGSQNISGNKLGYNSENIANLGRTVNEVASEVGNIISKNLNTGLVEPMSQCWFMPEAKSFFDRFVNEAIDKVGKEILSVLNVFVDALNNAGKCWAENVGKGSVPNINSIGSDVLSIKLSVDQILDKDTNGNIFIDEDAAYKVANSLGQVQANIEEELRALGNKLNADTAFLGYGQSEAIENCFSKILGSIRYVFDFLTEGENNLKSQIEVALTKYKETALNIKSGFGEKVNI